MKLALLGSHDEAIRFLETVCADGMHQLVAVYGVTDGARQLHELAPGAVWSDDWESVLLGTVADAVVVANTSFDDQNAEQLRKLVQAAVPLLVFHPCCETILAFELDMIRRDTGCVLVPYITGHQHPLIRRACEEVRDESQFGRIEQIVLERTAADRTSEGVLNWFTRDVNLLHRLAGDVKRVSAMDSAGDRTSLKNLSVNMTVSQNVLARWSMGPARQSAAARLVARAADCELVLDMTRSIDQWSLTMDGNRLSADSYTAADDHRAIMKCLARALEGQDPDLTWSDVCRDMEVVSAVQQSARRGRTIEIFQEEYSEEQTFKGIMAIGSCGILVLAFLFLIGFAVFEGLTLPLRDAPSDDTRDTVSEAPQTHLLIRLWPFYPFAVLLLLQLLRFVFRDDRTALATRSDETDSGNHSTTPPSTS